MLNRRKEYRYVSFIMSPVENNGFSIGFSFHCDSGFSFSFFGAAVCVVALHILTTAAQSVCLSKCHFGEAGS